MEKRILLAAFLLVTAAILAVILIHTLGPTPVPSAATPPQGAAGPGAGAGGRSDPPNPAVQAAAAARERAKDRLALLRLALASRDRARALEIINAMKRGGLETLKLLVEALGSETATEMRQAIVEVLDDILPGEFGAFQDGWYSNRLDLLAAIRDPARRALVEEYRTIAVPALIAMLKDEPDTLTRRWVASALGQLGGVEACRAVLGYLKGAERESGVDFWGTAAISNIWDAAALPDIRAALDDPSTPEGLRASLLASVAAIGTDEAVALLLKSDPVDLARLAQTGNPLALEELRRRLADPSAIAPVEELIRFFPGDPFAHEALARMLASGSVAATQKIALLCGAASGLEEAQAWIRNSYGSLDAGLRDQLVLGYHDAAFREKLAALEADPARRLMLLAGLPGSEGDRAKMGLAAMMGSARPEDLPMLRVMIGQDPAAWKPHLEAALAGATDARSRLDMAELVARSGKSEEVARAMLDLYARETDPELRRRALLLAASADPDRVRPMAGDLAGLASGEDPVRRSWAIPALGSVGGEEARQALRRAAERYPAEAVAEFGRAGMQAAEIAGFAEDSRPEVRRAAIAALGSASAEPSAAERMLWSLAGRVRDGDDRRSILVALGGVGNRATVQLLEAYAASHPDDKQSVDWAKELIFRRLLGL